VASAGQLNGATGPIFPGSRGRRGGVKDITLCTVYSRLSREGGNPWWLWDAVGFYDAGNEVNMKVAETMIKAFNW